MLASRLPSILPALTEEEMLEIAAVYSIAKRQGEARLIFEERPFRAPHHTASSVALVGGGRPPCPGEISLAHHGILFLDELPEFDRKVLETLREPLESGMVTISRAGMSAEFPAQFQLIAAMNPCPCGHFGNPYQFCRCTPDQVRRYQSRLSGPFLDRLDLHVGVLPLSEGELNLFRPTPQEKSADIRERVLAARNRQLSRSKKLNHRLNPSELTAPDQYDPEAMSILNQAIKQFKLSTRAYHRVLRVARTIADLGDESIIQLAHLSEALSYRGVMQTPV